MARALALGTAAQSGRNVAMDAGSAERWVPQWRRVRTNTVLTRTALGNGNYNMDALYIGGSLAVLLK